MIKAPGITSEVLCFCERLEMAQFLQVYFKHLFNQGVDLPQVQILHVREFSKFAAGVERLATYAGASEVRQVLLLADAAHEKMLRKRTLEDIAALWVEPSRVTQFLFTNYLEDVLVASLRQDTAEVCDYYNLHNMCEEYLASVNCHRGKEARLPNYQRNFLYAYFAGTERYAGLKLAECAQLGAFDLQHEAFAKLREKLLKTLL